MSEYIDRFAAVNLLIAVENRYNRSRDHNNAPAEELYSDLCYAEIHIGKMTAADVAPVRHGWWIPSCISPHNDVVGNWKCSECGDTSLDDSDYCPNCGAKMDKEATDGD